MYDYDNRIVLTLDAGGTNLVFSAIQANKEIVEPYCLPTYPDNLKKCMEALINGFTHVSSLLPMAPVAISFAFPGPADYTNGIIGDLPNFPSFRGGIPLGPYLQAHFQIPVFINNDGNLFAYGEALAGALPTLNNRLKMLGYSKEYRNLIGITFGTGFGSGVVINNFLLTGDNDCGGDVWVFRNKLFPDKIAEESVSIRAIMRVYSDLAGVTDDTLTPSDIYRIAEGEIKGDRNAARASFAQFGEVAGDAIAHLLTFADGIVVIGGGIMGAAKYIMPALINELSSSLKTFSGDTLSRLQREVIEVDDDGNFNPSVADKHKEIPIPNTDKTVNYNPHKRTFIMKTSLGTSTAISLGAYAYALHTLGN
ncbi:ROK family protein [Sphingobacterium alkalisoli]|uniref:ROK family protein n=1 Tax=Sphingobacterium alkalisoli TaxID=1874115 RepID=A0A4U0H4L5_9SPHI|nr:ROK family protein [Sphingobacterium alkalisoli]TJY66610.1 ROK family protein [Sphingobacterium alkalisoli]GGH15344.1 glucokinase [Sphingobacterium alkalisoli]